MGGRDDIPVRLFTFVVAAWARRTAAAREHAGMASEGGPLKSRLALRLDVRDSVLWMAVQFRRDSTKVLQRTGDWRQTVLNERPAGF